MKVAIDVHSLDTQASGNETFYRQLLAGLAQDSTPHDYALFYAKAQSPASAKLDDRFRWVLVPENPVRRICLSIPRVLKRLQPDVLHCQYILPPCVKAKSVLTIHDLAHERYPEFSPFMEGVRMRKLVPWSARRAGHIITVSEYSARDIETFYGVPRSKITVAYQAPSAMFRPRDKQSCAEQVERAYGIRPPFILYVGRVQARKNLIRLAEAYARVHSHRPELKLVIVGKADLHHTKLIARVSELGLKDDVILTGYVSDDDLPLFYNAAELFVFPSIFEGFGLPVLESMASGLPTIAAKGSCLEEIAGDGAWLIDPMSVDSITEGITRILADTALRRGLIERGLQRSACFSTRAFAAKVLEVYRSLA